MAGHKLLNGTKIHPACAAFPMLSEPELAAMSTDIAENGLKSPLIYWHDQLIDGRNRLVACRMAGLDIPVEFEQELDDSEDPIKFIISTNIHRRNLNESQRAAIAEELASLSHGGDRKNGIKSSSDDLKMSREQAAEMVGASTASMDRIREIKKQAAPVVMDAIKQGDLRTNTAKQFVEAISDKKEQARILSQGPAAVKAAIKTAVSPAEPKKATPNVASRVPSDVKPSDIVEVWQRQENRLTVLLQMVELLEPHEKTVVHDRLTEELS